MDRNKKIIIVLALAAALIIVPIVGFYPVGETTQDINFLGTVRVERYLNGGWNSLAEGDTLDVSDGYGYAKIRVTFLASISDFQSDAIKCTLVRSDGQFVLDDDPDLTSNQFSMLWEFNVYTVRPDKYHFSFSGPYSEDETISGETIAFFILGGTGTPTAASLSHPADVSTLVNEEVTVSWTYSHILTSAWTVSLDGESVKSGIGGNNNVPVTVSYSFTPDEIAQYTLSLTVDVEGIISSDSVVITSVGSTPTTNTSTTTTTTTTTTGTSTTTTTTTTDTSTTSTTSGTGTSDTDEESTDFSNVIIFGALGVGAVLLIYVWRKK